MKSILSIAYMLLLLVFAQRVSAQEMKRREYDLYIDNTTVNYTGKSVEAMSINGQIPGPTLEFTEGEYAVINVYNDMDEETSIHWHGLLLPNAMDGVPYLTTVPIRAHKSLTFEFPVIQNGTYWYHSHTNLQEQAGLYGSIVIHPKDYNKEKDPKEFVMMLSDWTNENPMEVLRSLKRASDWYSIRKNNVISYSKAMQRGYFKDLMKQE